MNKEQAVTYLRFSGFSDEQIKAIEGAFACPSAGVDCEDCPAYEPKAGWIPVSERLPEVDGKYLTYIVNEHERSLKYIMTCELIWNSISDNHWFPDDECASNNVVAWMPLPEPYKQESEKKK